MVNISLDPLRIYQLPLSLYQIILIQQLQRKQLMQLRLKPRVPPNLDRNQALVPSHRLKQPLKPRLFKLIVSDVNVAHILIILHPGAQAPEEHVSEAVLAKNDAFEPDLVDVLGVFPPEAGRPDFIVLAFCLLLKELYDEGGHGVSETII